MVTANCVLKTTDRCRMQGKSGTGAGGAKDFGGGEKKVWLTDRYRKDFPVLVDCSHCTNVIYNSVPLALPAEVGKWRGKLAMRLDFTLESGQELKAILNAFLHGAELPSGEYTTGHERRGAE